MTPTLPPRGWQASGNTEEEVSMAQEPKFRLDFMDGLRFGCGFYIAGLIFTIAVFILSLLALVVLSALGVGLGGLLGQGF